MKFRTFSDHKALESIGKVGAHNARVQRWLEFLTPFDYTLEYRKSSANGKADLPSCLPEPATEHDLSGSSSLTPIEDGGSSSEPTGFALALSRFLVQVWVGWCPATKAPSWVGCLLPLPIFAILAHTGHV